MDLDFSTTGTDTATEGVDFLSALTDSAKKEASKNVSNDDSVVTGNEQIQQDVDASVDALTLFEDENYIFTSEGIIEKSSLKKADTSVSTEPKLKEGEKIAGKYESYDELVKAYKELERKFGEQSSAVNKLRELQPVLPMLEAMLGDETFLELAEGYFTDPKMKSEALKKQLGISDDFVFDLNNALSDPQSDDAKVLNKLMQAKSAPAPKPQSQSSSGNTISDEAKTEFMKKHGLSEAEYNSMMTKAQSHTISLDDIYFLTNRENIISEAKKKAVESVKAQMQTAQQLNNKKVGGGDAPVVSPEDMFINSLQVGKGLFED